MRWRGASRTGHTAPAKLNMNTNELLTIVKRKRSPVVLADSPKPLAVGDVCQHCGRVVTAEPNGEVVKTETQTAREDARPTREAEMPAPVEIPKPKKSRANAPKN